LLERYDLLGKTVREARLPVIVLSNTCVDLTPFGRSIASRAGIHFVGGMEHGLTALGKALWWSERCRAAQAAGKRQESLNAPPASKISLDGAAVGVWSEAQARRLLQMHQIPVVPGVLAADADAAVSAAQAFGFPAVLKIQSSAITHKTDIGGVLLNLQSEDEIRQGFQSLVATVQARFPAAAIEGVLVSPMRPAGTELLVGILRDQLWGLVLAVGLGGIWTEAFKDTSARILPVDRDEIKAMLAELRGAALLQGARGQQRVDTDALADVIFRVSELALGLQEHLTALEINPLLVSNTTIEALDALVTWKDSI
jgi:acyl-CoA synthetase (NDP forming)